jgi:transglutaminase-like putative cysteine protease
MLDASSNSRSMPELSSTDGTINRNDPRNEIYDYRVISDSDSTQPQPSEDLPGPHRVGQFLRVPDAILEPLRKIAMEEVKHIPAEFPLRRARALEEYLRSSGLFHYSLHLNVVDPNLDPVLDFLVNRKEGHCGYYASALTLMLRSIDIPARMVNGFKGGDWNELAQVLSVRQKHAHSWVEALIQPDPDGETRWVSLDPTPGAARNEAVASVGGFATNFRQITDLVRYIWVFYIVGYNSDRQRFLLYEPIRKLIEEARSGFQMIGEALQTAAAAVFVFRDFSAFISVRGFFVSFAGLLALVGLFRGLIWSGRRGWRWYRGEQEESASLSASQVSYRRLTQLLSAFGLDRPSAETQHEFANRASAFLTGRGSSTLGVADVPPLVVAAYYRVRFGHRDLPPVLLEQLERRLDALEASLNGNAE